MAKHAKTLTNDPRDVVEESMEGLLIAHPSLARLDGLHVVLRVDAVALKDTQVALISGGGRCVGIEMLLC